MIDKVQKIREEVERIQLYTQSEVLKQVLDYIDEVQKEPVTMNKAEKFISEHTRKLTQYGDDYFLWLTPDQAKKAVEIAKEEMIEKACRGYCDDICEKGMCGMCYHKNDGKGQVKNTFKYNECYALQVLINSMKDE